MKRSSCFLFLPILVASAGCPTTDNNVGSLGHDARVADGPAPDAGSAPRACTTSADCPAGLSCGYAVADGCAAKGVCMKSNFQGSAGPNDMCGCDGQPILPVVRQVSGNSSTDLYVSGPYSGWAGPCTGIPDAAVPDAGSVGKDAPLVSSLDSGSACLYPPGSDTSSDAGNGTFVGCKPGPATSFCDPSSYTITCQGAGMTPTSIPEPASSLACKVPAIPVPTPSNTQYYCCPCVGIPAPDAAVLDAASVAKDAAPASPEAGGAHQCQLNADGTCGSVTPNTACTPFTGRRYDESAGCIAANWTTLWCCATAAGDSCGWPAATGCLQVSTDAGAVTYWTPALGLPSSLPGGQVCDQSTSAKLVSAPSCGSGLGSPCDSVPNGAQAVFNNQVLECSSRICLKPADEVGGVDTGPFCSSECSADNDCVGQIRDPSDPTDKRCAQGYTCAVPFVVGALACKKLCLCKDFLKGPPSTPLTCSSPSPDAAAPPDAAPVLMTPTLPAACATDGDCCMAMDTCMATAYLVGKAEYGSMVTSIANVNSSRSLSVCLKCIPPSIQVQCRSGFCVGEKISSYNSEIAKSHCGYVGPADAGAVPGVSSHALVDSGTGSASSPSTWGCGP